MFKVLHYREALGGSLVYQTGLQERLTKTFEQNLNDLKVVKIHSLSFYKEDSEFGLVAVVEIEKHDNVVSVNKTDKQGHGVDANKQNITDKQGHGVPEKQGNVVDVEKHNVGVDKNNPANVVDANKHDNVVNADKPSKK